MNKNKVLVFVGLSFLLGSAHAHSEAGLFSDEVGKTEKIKERLKKSNFEFSDSELSISSDVLALTYKDLSTDNLVVLISKHSDWRAINSILVNARLLESNSDFGHRRMGKIMKIVEKINSNATKVLLNRQIHLGIKNNEISFLVFALDWMASNKINPSLNEKEWLQVIESTPFNRYLVQGPSLKVHIVIREYGGFVSKHKVKPQLNPVALKIIQGWKEDPFETEKIASKLIGVRDE